MTARTINQKDLFKVLEQLSQEYRIFVPQNIDGVSKFDVWNSKDTAFLNNYRNTILPLKDAFFPLQEELYRYHKNETGYETIAVSPETDKRIIFGVRPCDARALSLINKNFTEGYDDIYYSARRKSTVLAGLSCTDPDESCFCSSLDSNPDESKNMDVMLTPVGDNFVIETVSPTGEKLLEKITAAQPATEEDLKLAENVKKAARAKIVRKHNLIDIDKKLKIIFENKEFWENIAAKCISCGVCTFFCPTCYCFDIVDKGKKERGSRSRCWDSCQFPVYTKMPMENPREEKWRRVRQKVCHKFEFYPIKYRNEACTGCGRCLRLCPVSWDITRVLESVPSDIKVAE